MSRFVFLFPILRSPKQSKPQPLHIKNYCLIFPSLTESASCVFYPKWWENQQTYLPRSPKAWRKRSTPTDKRLNLLWNFSASKSLFIHCQQTCIKHSSIKATLTRCELQTRGNQESPWSAGSFYRLAQRVPAGGTNISQQGLFLQLSYAGLGLGRGVLGWKAPR